LTRTIREGVEFIRRTPEVRVVTGAAVALTASSGAVAGMLVVHVGRDLGIGSDDWRVGLFFAAGAVGALLATVLLPVLSRRWGNGGVAVVAFAAYVPALVAVVVVGHWVVALVTWAIWFCANTLAVTNGITIRQRVTPDGLQGRVNTSARMIAMGGTPVGALLGGIAAEAFGVRVTYLLAVVPVAVAALVLWRSPVRRLD
jgi:MFS family permease